jgi:hypothetical protein
LKLKSSIKAALKAGVGQGGAVGLMLKSPKEGENKPKSAAVGCLNAKSVKNKAF